MAKAKDPHLISVTFGDYPLSFCMETRELINRTLSEPLRLYAINIVVVPDYVNQTGRFRVTAKASAGVSYSELNQWIDGFGEIIRKSYDRCLKDKTP
jgi:hypothetical protein